MAQALLPYDDRDGWIFMDGVWTPWREAKIHILSHSVHYASSVFEGERAYDGVIFKSREHSERLHKSAKLMGFQIPFSPEDIDAAKLEALNRNGFGDAYVRAIAFRGPEQMGVAARQTKIHLSIAVWQWGDYFADKMNGIRLTYAPWRRPAPDTTPCHAKATGLYMICTLSKHHAEETGYQDALMCDFRGQIAEATGANIFFLRDGAIHTPTPDCFLNGLTRQTVIGLAKARGIEVIERAIWPSELGTFSECFLTGSAAEITPVSEIGEHRFKPGQITADLMAAYSGLCRRKIAA